MEVADCQFDYCKCCKMPLSRTREEYRRIAGDTYCFLCFDLFQAVNDRQHFREAQAEFEAQIQRNQRLRPGGKYLD